MEPVEQFAMSTRPIKTMQLTALNRIMIQLHLQVRAFTCQKKRRENQHTNRRVIRCTLLTRPRQTADDAICSPWQSLL